MKLKVTREMIGKTGGQDGLEDQSGDVSQSCGQQWSGDRHTNPPPSGTITHHWRRWSPWRDWDGRSSVRRLSRWWVRRGAVPCAWSLSRPVWRSFSARTSISLAVSPGQSTIQPNIYFILQGTARGTCWLSPVLSVEENSWGGTSFWRPSSSTRSASCSCCCCWHIKNIEERETVPLMLDVQYYHSINTALRPVSLTTPGLVTL